VRPEPALKDTEEVQGETASLVANGHLLFSSNASEIPALQRFETMLPGAEDLPSLPSLELAKPAILDLLPATA